ncbi:Calx-beta domain-containing protein [Acidovorax sp. KKS102]|uniref:Calx-beta domain-containing protein n=1 Tax=Acidovorax sp. KKS102 TaxID=358220 RepID=UPI0009FD69FA|nr:Calx-beta domain-containing protein [Acidovorax sp. KKS102]
MAYSTADASATAGADYTAATGSVSFAAGQTSQRVSINILDDLTIEGNEYFHLNLGAITGTSEVVVADGVGTAFIGGNDQPAIALPIISTGSIVVSEADGYAEFVVRLNAPATSTITVSYTTNAGTAASYANEYETTFGTLSFAPGVTTQTVRVPIGDDVVAENADSFFLTLSNAKDASGAVVSIANTTASAIIIDNDTKVADINSNGTIDNNEKASLSVRDVVVDEKAGIATFDLILNKAASTAFSVAYSTADASATAGADYTAATGSVSFAAGQTSQRVSINILDDLTIEGNEYFHLNLGAITGTSEVVVADGVGTAFIGGNDQPAIALPIISTGSIVVSEADGYAEFVVRLNAPATSTITVSYTTNAGTAASYANEYETTFGTLSFAPGVTTQTVRVPIGDDVVAENADSFFLTLSNAKDASGAVVSIANTTASAIIIDNDTKVADINSNGTIDNNEKASLSVRDVVVDEKAGIATFDLILNKAASTAFSVAYSTADASATAGADYTAATGSVSFAAGQTSQRVSINILDDLTIEGNEYFHLNLGAITGTSEVVVADGVGTAFIGGNDQPAIALPIISTGSIVVSEADGYAEFVVRLNAPATSTITVSYTTNAGTAASYANEYETTFGTLSFAPGVTTQTVRVPIGDDVVAENADSFFLS